MKFPKPLANGLASRRRRPLDAAFGFKVAEQIFCGPVWVRSTEGIVALLVASVVGVFQLRFDMGPPVTGWFEAREGFFQGG